MLECKDIRLAFGGNQILKGLSHCFEPGLTALVGNNGTGKSTLLNIISGFIKPDSGQVLWQGKDLTQSDPVAIVDSGITRSFQDGRMVTALTAWEHVALGFREKGSFYILSYLTKIYRNSLIKERKQRSIDLMKSLDILHLAEKPVSTLSIGQRRLIALATCFAADSACYLLDEPTAGLDNKFIGMAEDYMKMLASKDKIVLLVEHNKRFVDALSAARVHFG